MVFTFRNLTSRTVTLLNVKGDPTVVYPWAPKGQEAHVVRTTGAPLREQPFPHMVLVHEADSAGEVVGLPDPIPGVVYIVSDEVGEALSKNAHRTGYRADVATLGTGPQDSAIWEPARLSDRSPNPRAGQLIAVTRIKMLAP